MPSLAHPAHEPPTQAERWKAIKERASRGLLSYNAGDVVRLEGDLWAVRSSTRPGFHRVDMSSESCTCEDFIHYGRLHDVSCRHINAVAIAHATRRRPRPCGCNNGWTTIGHIVIDENGEEVEEFAMYLCKLCAHRS
jgi:hypothetical protein